MPKGGVTVSTLVAVLLLIGCAQNTVSYRYEEPAAIMEANVPSVDPTTGLPFHATVFLSQEPFKMPGGFPRTPDAFNDRKTLKGTDVHFYSRLSLEEIKEFYRERLTNFGLTEVNPSSAIIEQCMLVEFGGWPSRDRLEVTSCDEAYTSTNNRRWVSARFIGKD